jgi:hypothetical protein
MMNDFRCIGLALCALAVLTVSAAAQPVQVESIRAQLFKEASGTLSEDIIAAGAGLWNAIIGDYQANSVLISVVVSGKPDSYDTKGTVLVTIIDDETRKRITQRRFTGLLFGNDGRVTKPILVDDHNCSRMRIVARTPTGVKTAIIGFKCGE